MLGNSSGSWQVLPSRCVARQLDVIDDDTIREALRSAGLPANAVEGIVGMTAGNRDLVPEQPRDFVTTTPTTLAGWAYTALRPQLRLPAA